MFFVEKSLEVSAAHKLVLDYESKCSKVHGHNWLIKVCCKSKTLNQNGMVEDFTNIKSVVMDALDHQYLNEVLPELNPTAENIAYYIWGRIPTCYRVEVQESAGNLAIFEKDLCIRTAIS